MARKFLVFFLVFVISLSALCLSAFAWEPEADDMYTSISLKLPDGRVLPIFYMPVDNDWYTATAELSVDAVDGLLLSWHNHDESGTDSLSVSSLLSLYGLSSGQLNGFVDGEGVSTKLSIPSGHFGEPETPKHFILELVFSNAVPIPPDPVDGFMSSIPAVFMSIAVWISSAVTNVMPMFYTPESGLTLVGILAVASLALSVAFLVIGIIRSWIRFR